MNPLPGMAIPHLAAPLWLLLLAAVPLLAWWHHRRHDPGALTYSRLPEPLRRGGSSPPGVAGRSGPGGGGRGGFGSRLGASFRSGFGRGAWRLHLPFYFRLAAFALLVLALARPQLGYAWEESLTEGIDIQLVLDVSGSMAAEDFAPRNRLEVAKRVARDFVAGRTGDRIGLTVFSGRAVTRSPLTTDQRMLALLLDSVEVHTALDGTAIGVALANGAARLKDSEAESKVMVLVTDGVNNTGAIDPLSAAAVCDGLGIRVYTVGVGTRGRVVAPMTQRDPVTGRLETVRRTLHNQLDEELLGAIAQRTGGRYFRATDAQGLAGIFAEIDRLERTPMETRRYVRYQETFQPLAWAALAALLLPLLAAGLGVTAEP